MLYIEVTASAYRKRLALEHARSFTVDCSVWVGGGCGSHWLW